MANGQFWSQVVQENGELGGPKVVRREIIYQGLNGGKVERFYDGERSYIYKPIGFDETVGHEWLVQETIAPLLPPIRVPRILAVSSPSEHNRKQWLIYEDLGTLQHCASPRDIVAAAGWIPDWHRLPILLVPERFRGHTPAFHDVWKMVLNDRDRLSGRLNECDPEALAEWTDRLPQAGKQIGDEAVLSHGDYHPGNVAFREGERIVLDWEFIQRNHRYWDLYSLMDITSFRYAKVKLTLEEREEALACYWTKAGGGMDKPLDDFIHGYYIYASVYSAWIAGLIEKDLGRGEIPRSELLRQRKETFDVFADCLRGLQTGT